MCLDEENLQFSEHYGLDSSKLKVLHCTAFYAGGYSDEKCSVVGEYAKRDVLQQSVGKCFSLKVTGVVLTPRTVCARVELMGDQLQLYRRDVVRQRGTLADTAVSMACVRASEGECERRAAADSRSSVAVYSVHSRAHITLGYTHNSEAVQAGDDLLHVLHLAASVLHVAGPLTVDNGTLSYYGDGQCYVQFAQPLYFSALFSAVY